MILPLLGEQLSKSGGEISGQRWIFDAAEPYIYVKQNCPSPCGKLFMSVSGL